ncbi:MAG: hypothetical protein AAF562_14795 [Pseudomonadota bacterium]
MKYAIRRAKGEPSENFRHVVTMGLLLLVSLHFLPIFALPAFERGYERLMMPDEPIMPQLAMRIEGGSVIIDYKRDVHWPVRAYWIGQIRTADGDVVYTKRAPEPYPYSPENDHSPDWQWRAWWENTLAVADPPIPRKPFVLCLRYSGKGAIAKTEFNTSYVCSDPLDPRGAAQ